MSWGPQQKAYNVGFWPIPLHRPPLPQEARKMGRLAAEVPYGIMGGARVGQGSLRLLLSLKSANDRLRVPEPWSSLLKSVTGSQGDTEAVCYL